MHRDRTCLLLLCTCCLAALLAAGCRDEPAPKPTRRGASAAEGPAGSGGKKGGPAAPTSGPRGYRIVHVFVALCDNKHQGIVPVPEALGNGQDAAGNLYWGARYGVRTFFRKTGRWREAPAGEVAVSLSDGPAVRDWVLLRRVAAGPPVYLLAEAYDGARMELALRRFFQAAAGEMTRAVVWRQERRQVVLRAGGAADLVCFVGHNGLMDRSPDYFPADAPGPNPAGAVVLACKSSAYFAGPLKQAACPPLITTSGLMAPEAYTLEAIVAAWADGAPPATIHLRAAEAYARYQKCPLPAAKKLFVLGAKLPTLGGAAPR